MKSQKVKCVFETSKHKKKIRNIKNFVGLLKCLILKNFVILV